MKICIPTLDNRGLQAELSEHFGRAPHYTLVDTASGSLEVMPNPDCHRDHHSCHHSRHLRIHDVEAVVTGGMGRRAAEGLGGAGISVMITEKRIVSEIIEAVRAGDVHRMRQSDMGHGHGAGAGHGHGHGRSSGHGSDAITGTTSGMTGEA